MTQVKFIKRPLEKTVQQLVDEVIGEFPDLLQRNYTYKTRPAEIPVNISETTSGFQVDLIAPGFDKSDFLIQVNDNLLTIATDKTAEESSEKAKSEISKTIRKEYAFRNFKRSFTLDEKIDATRIDASYVNGVLRLNLPKKTEVREAVKKIEIK